MPTISGDIALMPVGDVFLWVANRKLTVTVHVRHGAHDTHFVVRQGQVWQAASSDPREYLGQHLINFGYINEEQLQKAFDTQQETHVPLGRVLVMVDAVTMEQLGRVLLFKTRESLLEAMSWREGTFRVSSDVPDDRELDCDVPADLLEVHSEGVARARMWAEIRRVFPSDATRCDVLSAPGGLSEFDTRLIDLLARGASIGDASLELRSMDFQTYARLYDLYNRQLIRPRITTEPASRPLVVGQVIGSDDTVLDDEIEISDSFDIVEERLQAPPTEPEGRADEDYAPPPRKREGVYMVVKAERPQERPGVEVPAEAQDPHAALRIALAGRNWNEALLLSERILEVDPKDAEAIAARRVAETHVRRMQESGHGSEISLERIPKLAGPRAELAQAHLTSKERYVLSRIDGKRTLAQIAAVSPIQRAELLRIIEAFVNRGVLELT